MKTKTKQILFALSGLISAVLAFVCYGMNSGEYEIGQTYGGDAYTGIQRASAQAANNIMYAADIFKFGFGSILLIAGIVLIIYAITMIEKQDNKPEPEDTSFIEEPFDTATVNNENV